MIHRVSTCDSKCMPDNENIGPRAVHNIDCNVWDFLGLREGFEGTRRAVGRPRWWGVTPTGQRVAGRAPQPRHRLLHRWRDIVTAATAVGIPTVTAFILYHYFKV